jgi:hypothetical protein
MKLECIICGKLFSLDHRDSFCCSDPCSAKLIKLALETMKRDERDERGKRS